jgi:hypothetical protein
VVTVAAMAHLNLNDARFHVHQPVHLDTYIVLERENRLAITRRESNRSAKVLIDVLKRP